MSYASDIKPGAEVIKMGHISNNAALNRMADCVDFSEGASRMNVTYTTPLNIYEAKSVSPGASQTDYDAKTTGGLFGTVTDSINTTVMNNHATLSITVKLNANTADAITIPANRALTIDKLKVTNLFITTPALYNAAIDIVLFG